jgi:dTDP-4-dehydrorhamnose 3,5-epimerase
MDIQTTTLEDVKLFVPSVHEDERGFFLESFRQSWLPGITFVQENHSKSKRGTLRGLHYQLPNSQGKLVRVTQGEVFDVAVDLRKSSRTYGKSFSILLSEKNKVSMWVPEGFAHGFLVTSETAEFQYKCTNYYSPEDEHSLLWNDGSLGIEWPVNEGLIISDKDQQGLLLVDTQVYD